MKRILLATHGQMADGVMSAVRLIIGETAGIICVNAYLNGTTPEKELKQFFNEVTEEDQVLILTDLFGGSVNKELVQYVKQDHVYLIAGINLAMILEAATMSEDEEITSDFCRSLVETGKSQVVFVNDCFKASAGLSDEEVFL